jgi:hypothetical protein
LPLAGFFLSAMRIEVMAAVSSPPDERTRKAMQVVLQRLQEPGTALAAALAMGTSESTISRIKTERMEEVLRLLAHLGLKVVPADYKCVNPDAYAFLTATHEKVMRVAPQLIWEADA